MKRKTSRSSKNKVKDEGISLTAFSFMAGGALLGYLGGEFFLSARPHPIHWLAAIVISLLGYLFGSVIYRRYGEII